MRERERRRLTLQERNAKKEKPVLMLDGSIVDTGKGDITLILTIPHSSRINETRKVLLFKPYELKKYVGLRNLLPRRYFTALVYESDQSLKFEVHYYQSKTSRRLKTAIMTHEPEPLFNVLNDLKKLISIDRNSKGTGSRKEILPAANIPARELRPISGSVHIYQGGAPDSNRRRH